jgi:hypothetical protein
MSSPLQQHHLSQNGVAQQHHMPQNGVAQQHHMPQNGVQQQHHLPQNGVGQQHHMPQNSVQQHHLPQNSVQQHHLPQNSAGTIHVVQQRPLPTQHQTIQGLYKIKKIIIFEVFLNQFFHSYFNDYNSVILELTGPSCDIRTFISLLIGQEKQLDQ